MPHYSDQSRIDNTLHCQATGEYNRKMNFFAKEGKAHVKTNCSLRVCKELWSVVCVWVCVLDLSSLLSCEGRFVITHCFTFHELKLFVTFVHKQ